MAASTATSVEMAFRDLILANNKINHAINGRIYFGHVPQSPLPTDRCIIVTDLQRTANYHLGGEAALAKTLVQLDVWATDPGGSAWVGNSEESAGEQLRRTLSGYSGTIGSITITCCLIERDHTQSLAPENGSDKWRRRRSMDFLVMHTY